MRLDSVIRPGRARWTERPLAIVGALLAIALASRAAQIGNPAIHVDDQFYLLVGDRMLHGALPYVDIWDRKPVGLFLIYAAIRLLGGDGFVQYGLVAAAAATATAFVISRIARRATDGAGALVAGIIYLLYLLVFGGDGGQSPVFYNLPMALAGLLVLGVVRREGGAGWRGAAAMALVGVAIQIKYTAMFEGFYFGCVLLGAAWRDGARGLRWLAAGLALALIAAAPTAAAWLFYARIGHSAAFVFANFGSILARNGDGVSPTVGRLVGLSIRLAPLALTAWLGVRRIDVADVRRFVAGWCGAAMAAVLIFGSFFDHYALPMLVPLAIASAPVLTDPRVRIEFVVGLKRRRLPAGVALGLIATVIGVTTMDHNRWSRGWGPQQRAMAAAIRPRLAGCLFVFDGDTALYLMTHSCLPTRWPFPDHLDNRREDGAIGVDALAETQRIMAARPRLVVSSTVPDVGKVNWRVWRFMELALARAYRPVGAWIYGDKTHVLYERRAGA